MLDIAQRYTDCGLTSMMLCMNKRVNENHASRTRQTHLRFLILKLAL